MTGMEDEIARLRAEIAAKTQELDTLRLKLQHLEKDVMPDVITDARHHLPDLAKSSKLHNEAIARFSRQLILPEIGVKGQLRLQQTSVLIVGAGGLGCPSAIYLAAAGIGRLGIVDYDEVEISNLHRQILHTEHGVGMPKSASIAHACSQLNSAVECVPYHLPLNSSNAIDIIKQYDIVLDATDNVASRYLLNDACVLLNKPLVSGSALRFQGQLTVYNYNGGPCYRCMFPSPPPPETVTNCSDGGVLGVVPGIIGCLQALEAIKIATDMSSGVHSQKLLMFDGEETSFRTIRLRPKQAKCNVCGDNPSIKQLIDYEQFCGALATDTSGNVSLLQEDERISVKDFADLDRNESAHLLIDVREPVELDICKLPSRCLNIPLKSLSKEDKLQCIRNSVDKLKASGDPVPVFVVCRRGNDSQQAVKVLKDKLGDLPISVKDIRGGLTAWAHQIDRTFPVY